MEKADEVANAYERARSEAGQAFGDDSVLMERLVENARHVGVQLLADGQGAVTFLVKVKEAIEDPQRLLLDL